MSDSDREQAANRESETVRPQSLQCVRGDKAIAGVCSGLARDLQVDVILVRVFWLFFACFGVGFIAYLLCWIAFPHQSDPVLGREKRVLGVCLEIAKRTSQPVGLIRLAALGLLFVSVGSVLVGYILAVLILPPETKAPTSASQQ